MLSHASDSTRILSFMPFVGIWPHAVAEAQLLKLLREPDFDRHILTCGRGLPNFCTVMESHGKTPGSSAAVLDRTCDRCCTDARIVARSTDARHHTLSDFTLESDEAWIQSQLEVVDANTYLALELGGVPIGRIAAYETLIKFKKASSALSDNEFSYYLETLGNCLVTLLAGGRALAAIQPNLVLVYSPQYGVPGVMASLARGAGCRVIFVEGSSNIAERYSAVRLWDWGEFGLVNPAVDAWGDRTERDRSVDFDRALNHVEELSASRSFSVYSTKARGASARAHFGIDSHSPIVVAAVSSYDEAYSAVVIGGFPEKKFRSHVFVDQFDWIRSLVAWANERPEISLVIRLHPRDFANKREGHQAEQATVWSAVLADHPANVFVDHPSEAFPLHDLLSEATVLTTGWSATAIEAMLEGIPVVTYDECLPSYPREIHSTGESPSEYFANLDKALLQGRTHTHREAALEWLTYNYVEGTVRTGGRIRDRGPRPTYRARAVLLAVAERLVPGLAHRSDLAMPLDRRDRGKLLQFIRGECKSLFELGPTPDDETRLKDEPR